MLRADRASIKPIEGAPNVEFRWNSVVEALLGENQIAGVRVRHVISGEESDIACDGVFVSIGRKPASSLFAQQLELDATGYIVAGETTETSVPGVYAVGDVRTKALRQVITAAADGAAAAHHAEQYLAKLEA